MTTAHDQRPFDEVEVPDQEVEVLEDPGTTSVTTDERKVTWGYTRKVTDGNYGSEESSMYVTDMVPQDMDIMEFVHQATPSAFDVLKAQVWDTLNVDFEYTPDGRPQPVTPLPPVVPTPGGNRGGAGIAPPLAPPPASPPPKDGPSVAQIGYYADPPAFCKNCGEKTFNDQRQAQDDRMSQGKKIGPDWTCVACDKGVFRPGSYDYNQAMS